MRGHKSYVTVMCKGVLSVNKRIVYLVIIIAGMFIFDNLLARNNDRYLFVRFKHGTYWYKSDWLRTAMRRFNGAHEEWLKTYLLDAPNGIFTKAILHAQIMSTYGDHRYDKYLISVALNNAINREKRGVVIYVMDSDNEENIRALSTLATNNDIIGHLARGTLEKILISRTLEIPQGQTPQGQTESPECQP